VLSGVPCLSAKCWVQREGVPQSGPLDLLLGVDPKAERRGLGIGGLRVLGCSFCHFE
jgi:hypothetical protein